MAKVTCPYCRARLDSSEEPTGRCPTCGRSIAWLTRETDFVVHGVDIWRVSRGQRFTNACLLVVLAAYGLAWFLGPRYARAVLLLSAIVHVMLATAVLELYRGLSATAPAKWLVVLLALVPAVNALARIFHQC